MHHLSKCAIRCQKLHYSVPQFFNDICAVLKFDNEANSIKIFNVEAILAKKKIDSVYINWNSDRIRLNKLDREVKFDDIVGFVYGSFTSRFWMMRIGIS